MARRNNAPERRKQLIPVIARAFAEMGYRRTTTAELAQRCQVQETILYRLWPDKKQMFLAAIDHVYQLSAKTWEQILNQENGKSSAADRILNYEATHHGEFGLYRIVFAGLSESDDPEIHGALQDMYKRFHRFIKKQIAAHQKEVGKKKQPQSDLAAWAVVGLGTVANISHELGLLSDRGRKRLLCDMGSLLLEGGMK